MPKSDRFKYYWPSSAITHEDMVLLHRARDSSKPRIPISTLVALAIRAQYGKAVLANAQPETLAMPKAA